MTSRAIKTAEPNTAKMSDTPTMSKAKSKSEAIKNEIMNVKSN